MQTNNPLEISLRNQIKRYFETKDREVSIFEEIVKITGKIPLKNLDRWMSIIRSELLTGFYKKEKSFFNFFNQTRTVSPWLQLTHYDGFKREKALTEIMGTAAPNQFFFALLLRMLNDWVSEVRLEASFILPSVIEKSDKNSVIEGVFYILEHWDSWKHISQNEQRRLLEALVKYEIIESIKQRLITKPQGSILRIFYQLGAHGLLDDILIEIATTAIQPTLRTRAYRSLYEKRYTWIVGYKEERIAPFRYKYNPVVTSRPIDVSINFLVIFDLAIKDRSSMVRYFAAEIAINEMERLGDRTQEIIQILLQDKHPKIVARGEFILKNLALDIS